MKILKKIVSIVLSIFLLGNLSSCFVVLEKDNGKHKGWYKNSNNPHHPNSTNPGKAKGKHHK